MVKVVLKIPESEINPLLSKLVKLGVKDIKIKEKRKKINIFRYKNMVENLANHVGK